MRLPAADWPQFRGPGGMGTAEAKLPETWSDTENIVWKTPLPGEGASSPIIVGKRLFITAASGGADAVERRVLCIDPASGKILWEKAVVSELPEQGRIREDHGYASATPAANGTHVFVFFGKSGVFCFDHAGRQIWNTKVGSKLHEWGSAASLALYNKAVLVNASVESESLVALDQATGKEMWRAGGIKESWHAPVVAPGPAGKSEVVMATVGEILSFNADTGQPLWRCKTGIAWYMCPLPLVKNGVVYAVGGRSGTGGLAVRTGGSGDVTETHRLWTLAKGTNVPSPLIHNEHLYFGNDNSGVVSCVDLKTGEFKYSERLSPNPEQIYASPVLAGGRIFYIGRGGRMAVVSAEPQFKQIASAVLENGRGIFNASPAIHGDRLFIRSNKFLYCIGAK